MCVGRWVMFQSLCMSGWVAFQGVGGGGGGGHFSHRMYVCVCFSHSVGG